jgi:N4-gp56 family major capsid protein
MKNLKYNLQLFAEMNTNVTTSSGLTDEMKTYYSDYLIDNAIPKLVHDQFGQKHPIPKDGGKTIEFRKYSPLPKLTTPITEGVTPDGQSLTMTKIEATVAQYGGYVTLSDVLLLTAIDNNLVQATKLLGAQAGATLDTITREVLNGGTNVIFSGGAPDRKTLAEGNFLTVDDVKKAVHTLKNQNAEKINGSWVGIIHPDVAYDLTNDPAWKDVKTYSDPSDIYEGEIGKLYGVRFVETTEAKIWENAGANNASVYSTLILGDNAYGVTEVTGGGLQHIVKQLGSAGTGDPLDQRATAGWKATKVAERLVENYMVRIESVSTFNGKAN